VIAAISFIVAGAFLWLHYALIGATVLGPLRVWHVWIFATLCGAAVDAWRSKDRELRLAWCVLFFSWVGGLIGWAFSPHPLIDLTLKNLIVMASLLIIAIRPETVLPILLHGIIILTAYMASIGVIPSAGQRPRVFLAWSYPDVAAALQHASLIALGGYTAIRNRIVDIRSFGGWGNSSISAHRMAQTHPPEGK
jgi:hypothetical protein